MSKETSKVAQYTFRSLGKSDKQCLKSRLFTANDARRFWAKVDKSGECWLWIGSLSGSVGYGQFATEQRNAKGHPTNIYAHRVAWELTNGPIPANQHVLHVCDVPTCVNPAHLFLGTHRDNMRDAARKGRLHVSRPGKQTVSDQSVLQIRAMVASGTTQSEAARQFGVSKTFVCLLLKGKRRQHPAPRRRSA